jgi:VanZ family protein
VKIKHILKWLPALIWSVVIIILAIDPSPYETSPFPGYDKVLHLGAFGLLAILAVFPEKKIAPWLSMIVLPMIVGISIESIQFFLPARKAEFLDLIADFTGCFLAFVAYLIFRRIRARREH